MCNEHSPQIHADEWVQVKSKEEILATLDANGRLDELPFMPEMLKYCGAPVKVGKRAHKTCDPALGIGGRKMAKTVHLSNTRCNGAAHDGCLIFWKEEWLNPIGSQAGEDRQGRGVARPFHRSRMLGRSSAFQRPDPDGPRRDRSALCLSEHADKVRYPTAAVVGFAPIH